MRSLIYISQHCAFNALPRKQTHQKWSNMFRDRCKNNNAGFPILYLLEACEVIFVYDQQDGIALIQI